MQYYKLTNAYSEFQTFFRASLCILSIVLSKILSQDIESISFQIPRQQKFLYRPFQSLHHAYAGEYSIRQRIDNVAPLGEARMEHCCHATKPHDRQAARLEGQCRMLHSACKKAAYFCIHGRQRDRNSMGYLLVLVLPRLATSVS